MAEVNEARNISTNQRDTKEDVGSASRDTPYDRN